MRFHRRVSLQISISRFGHACSENSPEVRQRFYGVFFALFDLLGTGSFCHALTSSMVRGSSLPLVSGINRKRITTRKQRLPMMAPGAQIAIWDWKYRNKIGLIVTLLHHSFELVKDFTSNYQNMWLVYILRLLTLYLSGQSLQPLLLTVVCHRKWQ